MNSPTPGSASIGPFYRASSLARRLALLAVAGAGLLWAALSPTSSGGTIAVGRPAPEFPTRDPAAWINSAPLRMADLRGRVVVLDNDCVMWDALGNRYWPTVYLIDRKGRVRFAHVGETHAGSREAGEFERLLA